MWLLARDGKRFREWCPAKNGALLDAIYAHPARSSFRAGRQRSKPPRRARPRALHELRPIGARPIRRISPCRPPICSSDLGRHPSPPMARLDGGASRSRDRASGYRHVPCPHSPARGSWPAGCDAAHHGRKLRPPPASAAPSRFPPRRSGSMRGGGSSGPSPPLSAGLPPSLAARGSGQRLLTNAALLLRDGRLDVTTAVSIVAVPFDTRAHFPARRQLSL